jgi:hypothetical protein
MPSREGRDPQEDGLFCPKCLRRAKFLEWETILRHVLITKDRPAGRVLRHTTCEAAVIFLVRPRPDQQLSS